MLKWHTTHSNTYILTIKQIDYIIKYMKHLNITEHIESFSKERVILLYIYWYLSLSKNALYINLEKRKISLLFFYYNNYIYGSMI